MKRFQVICWLAMVGKMSIVCASAEQNALKPGSKNTPMLVYFNDVKNWQMARQVARFIVQEQEKWAQQSSLAGAAQKKRKDGSATARSVFQVVREGGDQGTIRLKRVKRTEKSKTMDPWPEEIRALRLDHELLRRIFTRIQKRASDVLIEADVPVAERMPSLYSELLINQNKNGGIRKIFSLVNGIPALATGAYGGFHSKGFEWYVDNIFRKNNDELDQQYVAWREKGGGANAFWRMIRKDHIRNCFELYEKDLLNQIKAKADIEESGKLSV